MCGMRVSNRGNRYALMRSRRRLIWARLRTNRPAILAEE